MLAFYARANGSQFDLAFVWRGLLNGASAMTTIAQRLMVAHLSAVRYHLLSAPSTLVGSQKDGYGKD